MPQIDTKGMEVAELNEQQIQRLLAAEKELNTPNNQEIYLLAVARHPGK